MSVDPETLKMLHRCVEEIENQRLEIARLRPKAEAYDNLAVVLALLPRGGGGLGVDVLWRLKCHIEAIEAIAAEAGEAARASGDQS